MRWKVASRGSSSGSQPPDRRSARGSDRGADQGGRIAFLPSRLHEAIMDLYAISQHFFGTIDIDALDPAVLESGRDRVVIAFGTERDSGRRFALWAVLCATGEAPDPHTAFKDPRERRAAELYAAAMRAADSHDQVVE
ncbi:hypothetical protein VH567_15285 [Sphingomonas sp. 4RDLI-65]|uniref:hypothetical protein n=1 Tax=Sphingomonas sp. 4RDLI-65 TaxID=3111641 RepID=UPI003C19EEFD